MLNIKCSDRIGINFMEPEKIFILHEKSHIKKREKGKIKKFKIELDK